MGTRVSDLQNDKVLEIRFTTFSQPYLTVYFQMILMVNFMLSVFLKTTGKQYLTVCF